MTIDTFTPEQEETTRLYGIIAKLGRNVIEDYRTMVWEDIELGVTDSEAHAAAVRAVATKYRIR